MSTEQSLPIWVHDREKVIQHDESIRWRDGQRPDYSRTNAALERERHYDHAEGSLEAIAQNLVRTFEMEASFKTDPQQWLSVVAETFQMRTNGGPAYTAHDIVAQGTYNLFLGNSPNYCASAETFESSYEIFVTAFPDGFHWELMDVLAGPPKVVFQWRHWGNFSGPYKNYQPTGETIEVIGLSIAHVNDELKLVALEHFFDTSSFLTKLSSGECPVDH